VGRIPGVQQLPGDQGIQAVLLGPRNFLRPGIALAKAMPTSQALVEAAGWARVLVAHARAEASSIGPDTFPMLLFQKDCCRGEGKI